MKRVYSTISLQEAELLRVLLRQNGIESILENEFSSTYSELGPAAVPLVIAVADADLDGAVRVVRDHLARKKS